jgi:hypothetical protein
MHPCFSKVREKIGCLKKSILEGGGARKLIKDRLRIDLIKQ